MVLNYYDIFILINLQTNYFRLLKIYHDVQMQNQYTLDGIIQDVYHYSNYILLITKSQSLFLFDLNAELQIQLPLILNNLFLNIYLSNINHKDKAQRFCIYINKNLYFIQYYENCIILDNNSLYYFKVKQLQIIQIRKMNHQKDSYHIVAVDLTQNALQQYYFDLIELTLLDKYDFQNFKLINPLAYQEAYEFITITSSMNNNTYLHIFQTLGTYPFKLKQTIQTGSHHTFVSFQKLYYFDKKNQIQVLDIKYLLLKFKPLLTKWDNLNLEQTLIFYITPESNNDTNIQISLNLSIFVNCTILIPLIRELPIILEEDNQIMLNLSDLYEGPIYNLKIQDNSNVLLEGPFLQSPWQDELSKFTYTIKQLSIKVSLTTIQLYSTNRQILQMQVYDEFNKFNEICGLIQLAFYISNNQILLIYFHETKTIASIFRINQDNLTLIQVSDEFTIKKLYEAKEVKQIKNLFLDRQNILFYVHNDTILDLQNNNLIGNLIFIQNSDELYLQLTKSVYPFLRIQIFIIEQMELKIFNELAFNLDKIQKNFTKYIKQNNNFYSYKQIYPINATINKQTLDIQCLMILQDFCILQFIQVHLVSGDFNLKFYKLLRISYDFDSTLHYIDENFIIIKQKNSCFVYDFRVQKQIYDYTFIFECNQNTIWQYNTTHYFIYSQMNKNLTLGQIAYRISILDDKKQSETCTLIAENKISKAEITLKINKISNKISIEKFPYFGLVFFILTVIILVIYSIRRCVLKQQLTQHRRVYLFFGQ
ncbi:unnamed protein product (macronuclear) [Paramecium tetraurelia]|uniref:Transmembrane protein n=1 Tax=Paramecium tetraurelia TaxID=5888 RepID=A0C8G6_PARTE|nr:uncharacterized protein GSPATT00036216001 [Paramecium tetraurelia]CAK67083.1 unnamed protein product [Paramecium tetraurelia]|eukprot:XP_001434480.1 hypothetical protein (macronuclear) [Paramecium tetraurelia strain d4-2]